ncbi:GntR family transcriptional regulator [Timonella senegalensis]|uniref:GntR family transcriptional regulator n=1 Tax=Timonella senegalensis TaxID=1465825 RepID=UPI002FDC9BD0
MRLFDESKPIFQQVADTICNDIISGVTPEGDQVPSTNEIAVFYRINPATAGKGLNLLVDRGILYKKRGIGMFVAEGARKQLLMEREDVFTHTQIKTFVSEAKSLGLDLETVRRLIEKEYNS